jgi:rhomboid protease GluP
MLVVTCPHCRSAVIQNADGTCPACRNPIPPEALKPLVVHSTFAGAGTAPDGSRTDGDIPQASQQAAGGRGPRVVFTTAENPLVQFRQQLWKNTPRVYVTKAMVAVNAVVFILMVISGAGLFSPDIMTLISWGANHGPATLDGQWWRLLTSMFIHAGLLHVAINMWVLWDIGHLLERLTGNVGYLILYVLSGLFGSLASVYWNPHVTSVGASGAVFGVFGGLMGFLLLRSDSVPKGFLANMRRSGITFLIYNVVIGLSIPRIDMAAHAGGFVAGLVIGVIMSQRLDRVTASSRALRNLAATVVGLLGLATALWGAPSAPFDLLAEVAALESLETEVGSAYDEAAGKADRGLLTDEQLAQEIESRVLRPWQAARSRFERLAIDDLPDPQRQGATRIREYLKLREKAWLTLIAALREKDPEMMEEFRRNMEASEAVATD